MTRQNLAVGRDHEGIGPPAAHAGFGVIRIIIRRDEVDVEDAGEVFPGLFDKVDLAHDGVVAGHERRPVEIGPAVVLHIGDLQPLCAEFQREIDEFRNLVNVELVDRCVDGERQAQVSDPLSRLAFLFMGIPVIADAFGRLRPGALEADLDMIEAGLRQAADPLPAQGHGGRDQIGVDAVRGQAGDEVFQIPAKGRFASGQMHLENAEIGGLFEGVEPDLRCQLLIGFQEFDRVGTISALQRASVGQFGQHPECRPHGLRHACLPPHRITSRSDHSCRKSRTSRPISSTAA